MENKTKAMIRLQNNCFLNGIKKEFLTVSWSFSYNSFVKFDGKKIGSHNMLRGEDVVARCYKGTAQ